MQPIVDGLLNGLTLSLIALAFTVVYQPTRVFFLALAGIYAAAPFVAWACLHAGWPWYLAAAAAILTGVSLSIGCEVFNHRYLERRQASSSAHMISSLGIYMVVVQVIALTWGNDPKVLRIGLDSVITVAGLIITRAQWSSAAVSVALLAGFYFWLRTTNLGLQFRGLADNPVEMSLRGYDVGRLRIVAFAIAGLLASSAALTTAFDLGFDPHGGLNAILLAVVGTIIGGQRSFAGPVIGGILLGVVRTGVVWFLSARWQEAVTFLLLSIFLLFRPGGLTGRALRLEVEA